MKEVRAILASLVLVVLLVPPLAAYGQSQPGMMASLFVDVEEASLKLVVHSDGSVEPFYKLRAVVHLPSDVRVDGVLEAYYSSTTSSTEAVTSVVVTGQLDFTVKTSGPMAPPGPGVPATTTGSRLYLSYTMSGEMEFNQGAIRALAEGRVEYDTGEEEGWFRLEELSIDIGRDGAGLVTIRVSVYPAPEDTGAGNVTELVEALERLGFARVEEIGGGVRGSGEAFAYAKLGVDVNALIDYAVAKGLPPSDAESVRKLLSSRVTVKTTVSLDGVLRVDTGEGGGTVSVDTKLESRTTGDIEEFNRLVSEHSASLARLASVLFMAIMSDLSEQRGGQPPMAPIIGITGAGEQPLLVTKPGSEEELTIRVIGEGSRIRIEIDYDGPNLLFTYASGEPSRDAEKTLAEIANTLSQYQQLASMMAFMMPGAEKLVPETVTIEPGPGVAVSATEVPLRGLRAVTVTIQAPETAPATKPATTAPPPPTTPTTPTGAATGTPEEATTQAPAETPTTTTASPTATTPEETTSPAGEEQTNTMLLAAAVVVALIAAVALLLTRRG